MDDHLEIRNDTTPSPEPLKFPVKESQTPTRDEIVARQQAEDVLKHMESLRTHYTRLLKESPQRDETQAEFFRQVTAAYNRGRLTIFGNYLSQERIEAERTKPLIDPNPPDSYAVYLLSMGELLAGKLTAEFTFTNPLIAVSSAQQFEVAKKTKVREFIEALHNEENPGSNKPLPGIIEKVFPLPNPMKQRNSPPKLAA